MVVTKAEEIVSIYHDVKSYPTPKAADISVTGDGKSLVLQSHWSQTDVNRKENVTFLRSHTINSESGDVIGITAPQEISNELWNKASPSGKLRAVVRSKKDKKDEDKQFIEIFDLTRKLKTIDVLALEKHGKIVGNDAQFGSFEWSSSEGHLLYMAEKKQPKTGSYFDPKAFKDSGSGDDDIVMAVPEPKKEEIQRGDEFVNVENWGEQLTERVHPVICILDIEANTVSILENLPDDVSPGQAMWTPDDAGVVVCAWSHEPYRLGLKFCCQRKSFLYYLDIKEGTFDVLSEEGRAVRFPRFSPDQSKLIYLDIPVGGAHNQCARLIKIDWPSRTRKVVVDVVSYAPDLGFPGIYTYAVSRWIWFNDNIHVALETSWRSSVAVVVINTESGKVQRIRKDSEKGSMGLLCVKNNYAVLWGSSPNQPFHLLIAKVTDPSDLSRITWIYPDGQPETLDWLTWSVVHHKPEKELKNPKYESVDYESILCIPKKKSSGALPPLIVFSHGGPNSSFDTSFVNITNFFCRCGYSVVMVNYRGSIGFGQDSILSLLGNIGSQDVKDVENAMLEVLAKDVADANCIFAFGGSHGGFLTTHMIGQYPDTFKAAASRNPVTNIASMFSTTDIPDWIFAQAGIPFDFKTLADEKLLTQLWNCSPMSYVDQVKTPMLLMIGLDDKRVPPAQGLEYCKALKARGVPVRYLTYPGNNHSIIEVDAEADCMVNTIMWFNKHIPA